VHATASALTITPKDLNGKLVQDAALEPCGPFTIAAK
jgi:hypothetical protein